MSKHVSQLNRLAMALPDIPRWVETRSLLLSGQCVVLGFEETDTLSFVVSDPEHELICVVGYPAAQAIDDAVADCDHDAVLLATPENGCHVAETLPGWTARLAWIHALNDASCLAPSVGKNVRLLTRDELDAQASLPPDLREELIDAFERSPIAAAFAGGEAVSFCYVAAETERLWDVSIDTLARYRRQGYAAMCATYMIEYMSKKGKQPVWGAEESNLASMKLAARLGFLAVDQMMVFHPRDES